MKIVLVGDSRQRRNTIDLRRNDSSMLKFIRIKKTHGSNKNDIPQLNQMNPGKKPTSNLSHLLGTL